MAEHTPVYLLNALWFKPGGEHAYAQYARAATPIVSRLGGRRIDAYRPVEALLGDWTPDLLFFVEWPSWDAFLALGRDPAYLRIAPLREVGLARGLLVRCDRLP